MGAVAVIGSSALIEGYALTGATVLVAEDAPAARAAWNSLTTHTALVILTAAAAASLGEELDSGDRITAVMPS